MRSTSQLLLSLFVLSSLSGCSLFFWIASNNEEPCHEDEVDFCEGNFSHVCRDGVRAVIDCDPLGNGNTCNPNTGECDQFCGDGFVQQDEHCDPQDPNSTESCNVVCRFIPTCGDGLIQPPEQCDGNTVPGGCDANCRLIAIDEREPNEDGSPSEGGEPNGNDFSIVNADLNGAFEADVLITTNLDPSRAGDEDVFAVHNPSNQPTPVRADIIGEDRVEASFGHSCQDDASPQGKNLFQRVAMVLLSLEKTASHPKGQRVKQTASKFRSAAVAS